MNIAQETDIIIVGAGPGGSTTALALAGSGLKVTLLDKAAFPRDKICGDALSGKGVSVLRHISPALLDELYTFPTKESSWGVRFVAPNEQHLDIPFKLDYDTTQQKAPGYIIKRMQLDNFLLEKALKDPNVSFESGAAVEEIKREENYSLVKTANAIYKAPLLIGADGAHSLVAKATGHFEVDHDHYCAGLRSYYKGVKDLHPDGFIELHFLKELLPGYFWIFPLPDGQANVGVGMLSSKVSKNKVNLKEALKRIISEHPVISKRFEDATLVDAIKGFGLPLGSKKRPISGEGYMLIGDAASLIDPFTGEGIAHAMISGRKAAEQAVRCFEQKDFSATAMKAYDDSVYKRLWGELRLSHSMQKLVNYPWLFNMVVRKANRNPELRNLMVSMFDNIDLRKQLSKPGFYLRLLGG